MPYQHRLQNNNSFIILSWQMVFNHTGMGQKQLVWSIYVLLLLAGVTGTVLFSLGMGEEKARHLGFNANSVIRILFIVTSLLTGACIAVAGIIGFVGLVIPHIVRLWVGTDYRILLISSFLSGSIFLILCDVMARTIISPNELPIGVITGIVGGVVFIVLLSNSKRKKKLEVRS